METPREESSASGMPRRGFLALPGAIPLMAAKGRTHRMFACGAASKNYVVGAPLPPSGLFIRNHNATWSQRGFNHPYIVGLDYDPRDPNVIYIAAGNGCIRSNDAGLTWRILTGWDVTELQSVAVDHVNPDCVYIGLPDGIAFSANQGRTWERREAGIRRKYTKSIAVDNTLSGRVVAGTERGVFVSDNSGLHWQLAGLDGIMVTHVVQSAIEPYQWLAATQKGGLWQSTDSAQTWERVRAVTAKHTLYNVSFDARCKGHIAACGWGIGLIVSEDNGMTWESRDQGLPSKNLWRVAFDPDHDARLYAAVHEEAIFVSHDAGLSWKREGYEGSIIYDFAFVPESGK